MPQYFYNPKTKAYAVMGPDGQLQAVVPQQGNDPQTRKKLNDLAAEAASADEVQRLYNNVGGALTRLQPNPWKARMLDVSLPQENGGIFDTLGGLAIGAPLRALGVITPQNEQDFQYLKSQQAERTAERQLPQKGAQTEADAVRYMLADISPYKDTQVNQQVINQGMQRLSRDKARFNFYANWAAKYGLNGVDPAGRSVEQAFQQSTIPTPQSTGSLAPGWSIKRK